MSVQETAEALVAEILGEKLSALNELIAIQENLAGSSDYQTGLYNGLVLSKSVWTGEEPQYYQGEKKEEKK